MRGRGLLNHALNLLLRTAVRVTSIALAFVPFLPLLRPTDKNDGISTCLPLMRPPPPHLIQARGQRHCVAPLLLGGRGWCCGGGGCLHQPPPPALGCRRRTGPGGGGWTRVVEGAGGAVGIEACEQAHRQVGQPAEGSGGVRGLELQPLKGLRVEACQQAHVQVGEPAEG